MTDNELFDKFRRESIKARESVEKDKMRLTDDEFVKGVMEQLPQKDHSVAVMWLIRIVAFAVGLCVLIPFRKLFGSVFVYIADVLTSSVSYFMSYGIFATSPITIALYGMGIAGVIFVVCKKKQII